MTAVKLTFAPGCDERFWTDRRDLTVNEVSRVLLDHQVGRKDGSCFTPASFRGDRRLKAEADEISLMVFDIDEGNRTLAEVKVAVESRGWSALAYSTHSHTAECPKYRVVLPMSRPWRAADYPSQVVANADWRRRYLATAAALGLTVDEKCTDVSRLFFLPRHPEGAPYETALVPGNACDVWSLPMPEAVAQPPRAVAQPPRAAEQRAVTPELLVVAADLQKSQLARLRATEKDRNDTLNKVARTLGGLLPGGFLQEDPLRDFLAEAAEEIGLEPGEIQPTINSGIEAGKREPYSPTPPRAPWSPIQAGFEDSAEGAPPPGDMIFRPFVWKDPSTFPRRAWVYGFHLIRKYVSITAAVGAAGKSALMVTDVLAMVTNRELAGVKICGGPLRVMLWNLEDPAEETERRMLAAMINFEVSPDDVAGRLFIGSGRDQPLCIAKQTKDGVTIQTPVVEALVAELLRLKIDVLVIDPFVSSHAVNENDNGAIDAVAKEWGRVAERANCAIALVHHNRKSNGEEATAESARGAGSLINAARSVRVLNSMTEAEGDKVGVEGHARYFRVQDGKPNMAPRAEDAAWFYMKSVILPNGDNVGVATPWTYPKPTPKETANLLLLVQKALYGQALKFNAGSSKWAGIVIAEIAGKDPKLDQKEIAKWIKDWIACGSLKKISIDDTGKPVSTGPYVEVGKWAEGGFSEGPK